MKNLMVLAVSLFLCKFLQANIGPEGFAQFKNYYFIETGTFGGGGLSKAVNCGAFKEFRSIEYDERIFRDGVAKFAGMNNVRLWLGNSAEDLWDMIKDIEQPATFWLDAHIFPPRLDGGKNCPLIEELEQLSWHPIKTHTILIDDMNCAGTAAFDYLTKEDLIHKIYEINPDYQIYFIAGGDAGEAPENILVAIIP